MDEIVKMHERLENKDNLSKSIDEVQAIIDQLIKARATLEKGEASRNLAMTDSGLIPASDPDKAPVTLAKLQNPVKKSFDNVMDSLKSIHSAQNKYSKAIDKACFSACQYCLVRHFTNMHPEIQREAFAY